MHCLQTWPNRRTVLRAQFMRRFWRPWVFVAQTVLMVGLGRIGLGCGTDPVNPEGCKDIEFARCEAAPACPAFSPDFDVTGCKRFYRDQCLKGLQTASDPGNPRIDACTRAIQKASECAHNQIAPCSIGSREIPDPCALITNPEDFTECGFLDDYYGEDSGGQPPPQDASTEPPVQQEAGTDTDAAAKE